MRYALVALLVVSTPLGAQQPTRRSVVVEDRVAADSDVASIDSIMRAFYDVISGPKGKPRQWARDKGLYVTDVRFYILYERNSVPGMTVMSHQQYVDAVDAGFVAKGFVEREIARCVRRFGNLATVWSAYEGWYGEGAARRDAGRGVNAVQLYWDGKRWWITSVSWDSERPTDPLPANPAALCLESAG
jgi:hypothetical protein